MHTYEITGLTGDEITDYDSPALLISESSGLAGSYNGQEVMRVFIAAEDRDPKRKVFGKGHEFIVFTNECGDDDGCPVLNAIMRHAEPSRTVLDVSDNDCLYGHDTSDFVIVKQIS